VAAPSPPAPSRLATTLAWLERGLTVIAAVLVMALMAVTVVDVLGRYLLGIPLPGGFEVTEAMLAVLVFASLPVIEAREQHIVIDLLDPLYSERVRRVRTLILYAVSMIILALLTWRLGVKAATLHRDGETSAILEMPLAPVGYFMTATAGAAAALLAVKLVAALRRTPLEQ
jgi:TRAP-type C4-dicarboxylate transport system permease small subunit